MADRSSEVGDTKGVWKRRLAISATLLFLFGLPLVGTVGAYLHAHSTMRASAVAFVEEEVPKILRDQDWEEMSFFGTRTLKGDLTQAEFESWFATFGEFQGLGELRVTRSTVGEREDQAWQYVNMVGEARFSKGTARVSLRAARRSIALPEWRLEEFELTPVE